MDINVQYVIRILNGMETDTNVMGAIIDTKDITGLIVAGFIAGSLFLWFYQGNLKTKLDLILYYSGGLLMIFLPLLYSFTNQLNKRK